MSAVIYSGRPSRRVTLTSYPAASARSRASANPIPRKLCGSNSSSPDTQHLLYDSAPDGDVQASRAPVNPLSAFVPERLTIHPRDPHRVARLGRFQPCFDHRESAQRLRVEFYACWTAGGDSVSALSAC